MTSSNRPRRAALRSASRPWQSPGNRTLPRARRRDGKAGIPPPLGLVASTVWPRLREPSFTRRIFVQPISPTGQETGPVTMPDYGAFRFTRVGGPTPDAPDVYSLAKNGRVSPGRFENSGRPIWSTPTGQAYAEAATYGERIRADLAADNPALLVLDREFETQSVDPMALEPESGLAWYDARRKNLELVISVQSPYEATKPRARSPICSATPRPPSNRAAADSAGATTRRSRFTSRWRRCSSRIVRSGSRTTVSSSFNRASSGTPSRSARG